MEQESDAFMSYRVFRYNARFGFGFLGDEKSGSSEISAVGLPINPYLWKASLETIDFMPLSSTDPFFHRSKSLFL